MEPLFSERFLSWQVAKYMLREVLVSLLVGAGVFLLIMLMFQVIRLTEFVVVHQVGLRDVGRISVYLMATFLPLAVPIAFLFSVIMGVSRANSEGEILALQVCGVSLRQIFFPLAVFSILVSLFCVYASFSIGPRANRAFELLITRLGNEKIVSALKPGVFTPGFFDLTLFAEQIMPSRSEMKNVFVYDRRDDEHPLVITAQNGILKRNPERGLLTLRLTDGMIVVDNEEGKGNLQRIDFKVYDVNLDLGLQGEAWRASSPPSHTYSQLVNRMKDSQHDTGTLRVLQVEYHRRFALGFSCFVFAVLGFSVGILSQRGVRSTAIIVCLSIAVLYWLIYLGATSWAVAGTLPAWMAVWLPNFLFAGVGYFCYTRYGVR